MSTNSEILFGFHPVGEMLAARRRKVYEVLYAKTKSSVRLQPVLELAAKRKIEIRAVAANEIRKICANDQHQGIAARVGRYPLVDVSDLILEERHEAPFILLLDQIVDPRNMGAIVRTALCAGVNGVIIPQDRSAHPTALVSKASAGALEHMRMARVANLARTVGQLKDAGMWVSALDRHGAVDLYTVDFSRGGTVLVIGGEEKGIRPLIRKRCDFIVSIDQVGPVSSLNASVAAAVAIYEVHRQRKTARKPQKR